MKQTEEEIRHLNLKLEARVEARTVELARANQQLASEVQERKRVGVALAAFSHLGQKLHSAKTEKEAAAIVAQTAKALISHDVCSIELYDSHGKLTPVLELAENTASQDALRSSISVSIRNGSRVVGVIGLKNSRADSFNYADANTLQALGDYCGGALERIHAEEARRETERRFSTFMTNAPALAWMKDARFRYVFTNEMFQRYTGLTAEQIVGKTDYDLWPDHVAFQMRTNDTDAVKTQSKIERQEQLKHHDGETRTLLTLRFLFTTANGEQFVAGMAVDISDQKRAEEALHRLPQSIIEAQEAERRRVARELHDGVNQAIASVKFRIQTAEQQILRGDPKWQETCSKTKDMLDSVLHQVRRLSRNLRPGELDDFGLVAAARSACQEFELRSGIQVRFTHGDFAERFPAALELSLYRIIQEALTNVEKHSGATLVEIDLTGDDSYVALDIGDDGCGFELDKVTGPRPDAGLGLLHMRERASLVGGVFTLSSSPGNGLRISIHVPVTRTETLLT
jgi:PAS domain S-box-containing protein